MMKSLFILSLPRSLSSITFDICRYVMNLEQPAWTKSGEVLNLDLYTLYDGPKGAAGLRYVQKQHSPEDFGSMCAFLDNTVQPYGYVYKDVVNPFVMVEWLKNTSYPVLKIRRDISEVAYSMLVRKWFYPADITPHNGSVAERLVRGLNAAQDVLDSVAGETVDYHKLIEDDSVLRKALMRLYPDEHIREFRFIDETFRSESRRIQSRRKTELYKQLEQVVKHDFHERSRHNSIVSAPEKPAISHA